MSFQCYLVAPDLGCIGCGDRVASAICASFNVSSNNVSYNWYNNTLIISEDCNIDIPKLRKSLPSSWSLFSNIGDVHAYKQLRQQQSYNSFIFYLVVTAIISTLHLSMVTFASSLVISVIDVVCFLSCCLAIVDFAKNMCCNLLSSFYSREFDVNILLFITIFVVMLQVVMSVTSNVLLGTMLCVSHLHCPLLLAATMSLRDYYYLYMFTADNYTAPILSQQFDLIYKKDDGARVNAAAVAINDTLLLSPGQLVPADCHLLSDCETNFIFNTAITDGESEKSIAAQHLLSDSCIKAGWIYIGSDSCANKSCGVVINSVKKGTSENEVKQESIYVSDKNRAARTTRANKYLHFFSKISLTVAVVAPSCWYLFSIGFTISNALQMFTSILLVSCPCALLIIRPYIYSGILNEYANNCYKQDFTIKDLDVFAAMGCVADDVVFCWDRTNTLTDPNSKNACDLRLEARALLEKLARQGYTKHLILSGNNGDEQGRSFLSDLEGIDCLPLTVFDKGVISTNNKGVSVYFNCSAKNKMETVTALQQQDKTVVMVGDGDNDLLAMAQADVSIAIWHNTSFGSILPTVMADITLANTLEPISNLFSLACSASIMVTRSLCINICYNILALAVAAGISYSLWPYFLSATTASTLMIGSMVLCFTTLSLQKKATSASNTSISNIANVVFSGVFADTCKYFSSITVPTTMSFTEQKKQSKDY